ncbi:hypothetical protein PVAND_003469 [Polypedilum vanderplanki]|uniref:Potassium channel domain-containing protein n=1 Tax=Polypedilum vanderplanki TaxID=319348 RepID=A0A9J6BU56_POLVA|nr:hypothetical protein PVAND_003469 [Polypedilum vanderplanki]
MERKRSIRRRPKPPFERLKDHCRAFTAFMFSNVGITFLVVLYIIGGSFMFIAIEKPYDQSRRETSKLVRNETILKLWEILFENDNMFNYASFNETVEKILLDYQNTYTERQRKGVTEDVSGKNENSTQWTFSGGFLYCLTVITTIGYGNITPSTELGKIATIFYAIIGMPLFLLYLSNIGDILAKSFKWIYAKCCLCRVCPNIARRRLAREKHKEKLRQNGDFPSESGGTDSGSISSYENDSEIEMEIMKNPQDITVPIPICVAIMIGYILLGAFIFDAWEGWGLLDSSYFCFISLSSIGLGDFSPAMALKIEPKEGQDEKDVGIRNVDLSFIFCSVYLLLGMALIAMCFNLMQEQVMHKLAVLKACSKQCFKCKRQTKKVEEQVQAQPEAKLQEKEKSVSAKTSTSFFPTASSHSHE